MEYIAGRNLDTIMVKDKAKVITGLNNILTVLKRNKIVHGDLLPHNFIITTDDDDDYCVRVVDFDWAGEESKCTYPLFINMGLQWPSGVQAGSQITHQHDLHLVNELRLGNIQLMSLAPPT